MRRAAAAIPLQEWQRKYVEDDSRFKLLVKSVQVGGSFAVALEVALSVIRQPQLWILLSKSERQSKELMEKVKTHITAMGVVAVESESFFEETDIKILEIRLPNGGRVLGLPANADTARGFSGNVVLDEFAIHKDAKAIWKAMMGRAMRGYKVRVVSSFKGRSNKFYELAKDLGLHDPSGWPVEIGPPENPVSAKRWSGHWVSLEMAVAQGLQVDVDELYEAIGDQEIIDEEFKCIPVDTASDYIPLELVLGCESDQAAVEFDYVKRDGQVCGFDVARKKDGAVIWVMDSEGGVPVTRGVVWMFRKKFSEMREELVRVIECCDAACIDATGIGAQLGEEMEDAFPGKAHAVQFNYENKSRMATALKTRLEDHTIVLPEDNRIRRGFQAVKKHITPAGNVVLDAARTEAGHADEFWAAALANDALSRGGDYVPLTDLETESRTVLGNLMARAF